jgi:transporter family protein
MSALLLISITIIVWGVAAVMDKLALKQGDPLLGLTIRAITVLVMLLAFIIANGKIRALISLVQNDTRSTLFFMLSGLLAGFVGMLTYYGALRLAPVSQVVPVTSAYPLVVALLSVLFLGEQLSFLRLLGIILIISGVYLIQGKVA